MCKITEMNTIHEIHTHVEKIQYNTENILFYFVSIIKVPLEFVTDLVNETKRITIESRHISALPMKERDFDIVV